MQKIFGSQGDKEFFDELDAILLKSGLKTKKFTFGDCCFGVAAETHESFENFVFENSNRLLIVAGEIFLENGIDATPKNIHEFIETGAGAIEEKAGLLKGMFSILLFNKKEKSIMLINDKMGFFPVFVLTGKCFCSDPEAIILAGTKKELDYEAITEFFNIGFTLDGKTFIKGMKNLSPATLLEINPESYNEKRYFKLRIAESKGGVIQRLDNAFSNAIRTITRNRKKVLFDLSGGMDSRLVLGYLNRINSNELYAYTFIDNIMENSVAEELAEHYKINHLVQTDNLTEGQLEFTPERLKNYVLKLGFHENHFGMNKEVLKKRATQLHLNGKQIGGKESESLLLEFGFGLKLSGLYADGVIGANHPRLVNKNIEVFEGKIFSHDKKIKGILAEYQVPVSNRILLFYLQQTMRAYLSTVTGKGWERHFTTIMMHDFPVFLHEDVLSVVLSIPNNLLKGYKIYVAFYKNKFSQLLDFYYKKGPYKSERKANITSKFAHMAKKQEKDKNSRGTVYSHTARISDLGMQLLKKIYKDRGLYKNRGVLLKNSPIELLFFEAWLDEYENRIKWDGKE